MKQQEKMSWGMITLISVVMVIGSYIIVGIDSVQNTIEYENARDRAEASRVQLEQDNIQYERAMEERRKLENQIALICESSPESIMCGE